MNDDKRLDTIGFPDNEARKKVKQFVENTRPDLSRKKAVYIPEVRCSIFIEPGEDPEEAKTRFLEKLSIHKQKGQ